MHVAAVADTYKVLLIVLMELKAKMRETNNQMVTVLTPISGRA